MTTKLTSSTFYLEKKGVYFSCTLHNVGLVDHARTALYIIAKSISAQSIWLPSYHCPTLVEPFLAAGKKVGFYPVTATLSADYSFLSNNIQPGDALIAIRYFGFDCDVKELATYCKKKQVLLIEDLAHAAFVHELYGEIGVTSLVKFYSVTQGGELLVAKNSDKLCIFKKYFQSLPSYKVTFGKKPINKIISKFISVKSDGYRYFVRENMSRGISLVDSEITFSIAQIDIINTRRKNYCYLS